MWLASTQRCLLKHGTHATLLAVFHAGPSTAMHWIDTTGGGSIDFVDDRPGPVGMNGAAVMYDTGLILTAGGGPDYQDSPASAATSIIDITGTTVSARAVDPMAYERAYHLGVALPDGSVFVVGGQPLPIPFTDTDAVLVPGAHLLLQNVDTRKYSPWLSFHCGRVQCTQSASEYCVIADENSL